MKRIFFAIFLAGVVSLMMELSLLREFVYVIGSSAFSNSLIISVFLAGLAAGTYVGSWKRIKSKNESGSRTKLIALELLLLTYIFLFYVTKDYFIYVTPHQWLVMVYFIVATFLPSFVSGATYTTFVELLYHRGEKYIVAIYAISTMGNVIGGLVYGYVFVYLVGIQPSYIWASILSVVTIGLIYRFPLSRRSLVSVLLIGLGIGTMQSNVLNRSLVTLKDLLYQKYSPFGLVEVWRMDDGKNIEMTINNVHQYFSYDWDNLVHEQWAQTALEVADPQADVLLLGYGTGISTAAFLRSDKSRSVDTVENCDPVLEAGKIYFPEEYRLSTTDPRSHIVVADFRNFIRFTDRKYDVVLLDHSITDPYYSGFFTLDFFDQIKHILKPHGVVASLGVGLSWQTTHTAFPFMYTYNGPGREEMSQSGYFLRTQAIPPSLASRFTLETVPFTNDPVYTDHEVFDTSVATALHAIKPRVSHTRSR
jgi:spermidine synthase